MFPMLFRIIKGQQVMWPHNIFDLLEIEKILIL